MVKLCQMKYVLCNDKTAFLTNQVEDDESVMRI